MAKIESLSVLLDPSGKMLLSELDKGIIANIQTGAISSKIKNTELSGDPTSGTVEAKRFANAQSQEYGTARAAGKGQAVKGKTVTIPINVDREFIEEIENKDIKLLGVDGLLAKRSANHRMRMVAELDTAFFSVAATTGTAYTAPDGVTAPKDILENAALTLSTLKTAYVDGVPRSMMSFTLSPAYYSAVRDYLDTVKNTNVDTTSEEFFTYHGVTVYQSINLPDKVDFILQVDGSIAQPVMVNPYAAEKIPLSEAMAVELFWYYGTKAVTPELVLVGKHE